MIDGKKTKWMLLVLIAIALVYSMGGGFKFTVNWMDVAFYGALALIVVWLIKRKGGKEL